MMDPCIVCWTSSWVPIENAKATTNDFKLRDGTYVRCGYCAMHLALVAATKQITELRTSMAELREVLDGYEST